MQHESMAELVIAIYLPLGCSTRSDLRYYTPCMRVKLIVQNEEEAGEVKAIEAPPERLMIEPAKPAVPERFAAAEKALEEQLLREEQEELERERYALIQCICIHLHTTPGSRC